MRIFQNKKVGHLFTHNSARDGMFFILYLKAIINQFLYSILHNTLFYKRLIYKKLGLGSLKTQEASTAAMTFPTKLLHIEN